MPRIESLKFGSIVVGAKRYSHDVLIFPDGNLKRRRGGFWRFGSHDIRKGEIDELVRANPEVIVVGTGTSARAKLPFEVGRRAAEAKVELIALPSEEAAGKFNHLVDEGKRVAALIHITC